MNTTETPSKGNQPSHYVYRVQEAKEKNYFTRIGAAWQHKDSKGFTIQLDCVPLDGKVVLYTATEKKAEA